MLLSAFHVSYPTHARKNWLLSILYWLIDHSDKGVGLNTYFAFVEKFGTYFDQEAVLKYKARL